MLPSQRGEGTSDMGIEDEESIGEVKEVGEEETEEGRLG